MPAAACCEGTFGFCACGTGRRARCLFGNQNIENQRFFATPSFAIFVSAKSEVPPDGLCHYRSLYRR
ncbi:hypothetical protein ELH16_30995 (plasmid) [Rhizobium ruizarguesonis]|nr:hypothetical protein ELH20_31665 [Rhizobium ruizarguesonis]TBD35256.1 hypothetical protein ELH17_29910 [Rhizobium ruizarguesonis]TBD56381.1 hypothetical protein ELH16_30995 [Rhizobium ruizarguesonis]TBF03466.1 hypothetical protein ELG96_29425 [Rhizobium ruizarguesonis]